MDYKFITSASALALISLGAVQCHQKRERPLNIVFFLVDDLGWSDTGCYGSTFYETPNIDRLSKEGVRFTSAYAACHVSSPSRASILSGKYPATLNLTDWLPGRQDFPFQKLKNVQINQHLPYEEITLPEILKANGYNTAIFGKWHLGEDPSGPLQHGFDLHVPHWAKGWPLSYHAPFKLEGLEGPDGEYLTDHLTDEALKYIEANKEKPFFLYLSHFAVHDPIQGRPDLVKKYREKLSRKKSDQNPAYILEGNPDAKKPLQREELDSLINDKSYAGYSVLPNQTVKIKQRQDNVEFAAMVESMDESLGRVLAKLKELGIENNTLIIFYSDNGGMSAANFYYPDRKIPENELDKEFSSSNLPLRGAKGWMYEGGIRVPLIVKWPGKGQKGTLCDVPVTSPDFLPSILEIAGIALTPEQRTDGVSFVPLLKGETKIDRDAIYWHFPHYSNHGMQSPGGAIRCGDYKLLEYYENNTVQLFNLKEDIGEMNDLSKSNPDKVSELRDKLHAWRNKISAKMMSPNPDYKSSLRIN